MLKKVISLLLVGLLLLGALGACGPRELPATGNTDGNATGNTDGNATGNTTGGTAAALTPESGAELLLYTEGGDTAYGNAVAAAFNKQYPDIKITVQEVGMGVVSKMTLDAPAGKGADVFIAPHDQFSIAKDAGLLLELDPGIANTVKGLASDTALKTTESDGNLYGVPVSIETYALFYNKALVTGTPATTMEQIEEEAKTYNDHAQNKFWFLTIPTDGSTAFPFLSLDGFQLFGPDGADNDHPGFDKPEFEKGLERIAALKALIPMQAADLSTNNISQIEQNFTEGKTAYYISGPWNVSAFKKANVDFGVAPLPTLGGKQLKPFGIVQNAYVSAYSKYPNAAQLLAEFLLSEEAAALLYSNSFKITALKDISNVEGLKDDQQSAVFVNAFNSSVPMPIVPRMSYYWTIMTDVLPPVFDGTITPQAGATKAQTEFNNLVASE